MGLGPLSCLPAPLPLGQIQALNPAGTGLPGFLHPEPSPPCGQVPVAALADYTWWTK